MHNYILPKSQFRYFDPLQRERNLNRLVAADHDEGTDIA